MSLHLAVYPASLSRSGACDDHVLFPIVHRLNQGKDLSDLNLLKVLIGGLVLDLDVVLILVLFLLIVIRLESLGLALTLGLGSLGLLGGSKDLVVVRTVVTGRHDNRRRALLAGLGGGSLGGRTLGTSILSKDLLLESGPGVASGADGQTGELGEL